MHVILTTNYSPWSAYSGGGQRSTHNLASALAGRGHHVEVVYTKTPFEEIGPPKDLPYSIHWALLPTMRTKRASWLRNFTIFSVYKKVKSLLQDQTILHSNGEEGALLPTLKRNGQIPFLLTPRYPKIPDKITGSSKSLFHSFVHIKQTKYHLLGKALAGADIICPTSNFTLQMLKKHYYFINNKTNVIPNGVDSPFLNVELKSDFDNSLIFFGRLAHSKGVDTFIDALALIKHKPLKVLIIGRGELEQHLKKKGRNLGADHQISFKPWMSQSELKNALQNASIAVLPSREESFGNTMAEAMAAGTPVISTTAGSIPEVVIDGETGLLVPPSNQKKLSEAVVKLMGNHQLAQSLAINGRKRVQKHFTWKAVARAYEKAYKSLLNE